MHVQIFIVDDALLLSVSRKKCEFQEKNVNYFFCKSLKMSWETLKDKGF